MTNMDPAAWTTSRLGPAVEFDGGGADDDYIQTQLLPGAWSGITLSIWVRLDAVDSYPVMLSYGTSGDACPELLFHSGSGKAQLDPRGAGVPARDTIDISGTGWHHIVGVADGTNVALYRDGLVRASVASSYNITAGSVPLRIGRRGDGALVMNGALADVRVWSRALSAAEVLELYAHPWDMFVSARRVLANVSAASTFPHYFRRHVLDRHRGMAA